MDRNEISGYVQIAVGIAGMVLTALSSPSLIAVIKGRPFEGRVPTQLEIFSQELSVFAIILSIMVLMGLIFTGVVTTASEFLSRRGYIHSLVASTLVAGSVFAFSISGTLAVFNNSYWVGSFFAGFGMIVSAWVGIRTNFEGDGFSTVCGLFVIGFLLVGLGILASENSPKIAEERSEVERIQKDHPSFNKQVQKADQPSNAPSQ